MNATRQSMTGLAAYRAVAGADAEPEEFMKMAIDSLRTFLLEAESAIIDGDRPAKAKALNSAAKLVEFILGLTGTEPGPLSLGLADVYRYILAAILRGNAADDVESVAAGRVAIEQLGVVWRAAFPDAFDHRAPYEV
jgi:flagellin-specific chaperone FliS